MPKAKGCRLKHVADARMNVWIVAAIRGQLSGAQKSGQILVGNDVLQAGDDNATRALKHILIAPGRMLLFDARGQHIVPAQKENGQREQAGILVGSRVAEHYSQLIKTKTFVSIQRLQII